MSETKDILLCLCGEQLPFEMVGGIPRPAVESCPFCGVSFEETSVALLEPNPDEMPEWMKIRQKEMWEPTMSETDRLYESRIKEHRNVGY